MGILWCCSKCWKLQDRRRESPQWWPTVNSHVCDVILNQHKLSGSSVCLSHAVLGLKPRPSPMLSTRCAPSPTTVRADALSWSLYLNEVESAVSTNTVNTEGSAHGRRRLLWLSFKCCVLQTWFQAGFVHVYYAPMLRFSARICSVLHRLCSTVE